jgi:hypothetical protein
MDFLLRWAAYGRFGILVSMTESHIAAGSGNISPAEAEAEIRLKMQEAHVLGANDYELSALNELVEKLQKGECSSLQAMDEAQKIMDRKTDYH